MKRKLYILGGIALALIVTTVIFGYSLFSRYAPELYVVENGSSTSTVNTTTGETTPGAKTFTLVEVAKHTDVTSCYSVISGSVYDLTMWINAHPGGKKAILSICGVDGTEKFMNKHRGGEKFMTVLARFKIGTLAK